MPFNIMNIIIFYLFSNSDIKFLQIIIQLFWVMVHTGRNSVFAEFTYYSNVHIAEFIFLVVFIFSLLWIKDIFHFHCQVQICWKIIDFGRLVDLRLYFQCCSGNFQFHGMIFRSQSCHLKKSISGTCTLFVELYLKLFRFC